MQNQMIINSIENKQEKDSMINAIKDLDLTIELTGLTVSHSKEDRERQDKRYKLLLAVSELVDFMNNEPTFSDISKADVLKLAISLLVDGEQTDKDRGYGQITKNVSENVDGLIHKLRKNKYGLEMTPLEQELEDIKIGLKDIERYQGAKYVHPEGSGHPKSGKMENPKEFFERVYGKFWSELKDNDYKGVIYQNDLMAIDKTLWIALRNHFDRNESQHIRDFLPKITNKSSLLIAKAKKAKTTEISRGAEEMIRRSAKASNV